MKMITGGLIFGFFFPIGKPIFSSSIDVLIMLIGLYLMYLDYRETFLEKNND